MDRLKDVLAIDRVIIEGLPADMDGSGTYVSSSGATGNAFDSYLPRSGWLLDVLLPALEARRPGADRRRLINSSNTYCSVKILCLPVQQFLNRE